MACLLPHVTYWCRDQRGSSRQCRRWVGRLVPDDTSTTAGRSSTPLQSVELVVLQPRGFINRSGATAVPELRAEAGELALLLPNLLVVCDDFSLELVRGGCHCSCALLVVGLPSAYQEGDDG